MGKNLNLKQALPPNGEFLNVNCCRNPDCENFGVFPDPDRPDTRTGLSCAPKGGTRKPPSNRTPVPGAYKLISGKKLRKLPDGAVWNDGRQIECIHPSCKSRINIRNNEFVEQEVSRLLSMNGVIGRKIVCKKCGADFYKDRSQFVLDGSDSGSSVRIRHFKPNVDGGREYCAVTTIKTNHKNMVRKSINADLLGRLINGESFNGIMRNLKLSPTTLYHRIFWLERVLLNFEKFYLDRWKIKTEGKDFKPHHHLCQDNLDLTINWEHRGDNRNTVLTCSVTADMKSGYVYRADPAFDPTVIPTHIFRQAFGSAEDKKPIIKEYEQKRGNISSHPLMHYQRPTGLYEEPVLFAAAIHELRTFVENRVARIADVAEREQLKQTIEAEINYIDEVRCKLGLQEHWSDSNRSTFSGALTSSTYTHLAHWIALRQMLPEGEFTVVTEWEGKAATSLPLAFSKEIKENKFTWLAMKFDKYMSKFNRIEKRQLYHELRSKFYAERGFDKSISEEEKRYEFIKAYFQTKNSVVIHRSNKLDDAPFVSTINQLEGGINLKHSPKIVVWSPVQSMNENDKNVAFPLVPQPLRGQLLKFGCRRGY